MKGLIATLQSLKANLRKLRFADDPKVIHLPSAQVENLFRSRRPVTSGRLGSLPEAWEVMPGMAEARCRLGGRKFCSSVMMGALWML